METSKGQYATIIWGSYIYGGQGPPLKKLWVCDASSEIQFILYMIQLWGGTETNLCRKRGSIRSSWHKKRTQWDWKMSKTGVTRVEVPHHLQLW